MFNYLIKLISPPEELVKKSNKAITRVLWYPSTAHIIKRDILYLDARDGGIGFPNLHVRVKVNRLMFYIRVLQYKEVLSWRRCFNHFYGRVERLTKRQLRSVNVPTFYKEIRIAVIESAFRRNRHLCSVFNQQFSMDAVTGNKIYKVWINQNYKHLMIPKHILWADHLGVEPRFIKKSWSWSKVKYVDGNVRDIHYRLMHRSLYTNHRVAHFTGGPNFCTLCALEGLEVREDNIHLFVFCTRAQIIYHRVVPILKRIAGVTEIPLSDLILGKKLHDPNSQICFNLLIQHVQLAIWQSRRNLELNRSDTCVLTILQQNIFRNLCKVKMILEHNHFFLIFGEIILPSDSVDWFQINRFCGISACRWLFDILAPCLYSYM